jgi:hypothetical protein
MIGHIIQTVNGTLSSSVCKRLVVLAQEVPDDGVILDLYCGEGRSTVVMATALAVHAGNVKIVALDTHITDPLSMTPYEDGTMARFYAHLRRFNITNRVIPLTTVAENIPYLLNRRSINLVVIQAPACAFVVEDAFETCIEVAQYVVRKLGRIVLIRPAHIETNVFRGFISDRFNRDFNLIEEKNGLIIYEASGAQNDGRSNY